MKPDGFKKKGRTFSLVREHFSEHYNLQGSAWNSSGSPWRFYVNCGISFPDLPFESPGSGMWAFHAHTRLTRIIPEARAEYDVTDLNLDELVIEVGETPRKCSAYFFRRHQVLRDSLVKKHYEFGFPYDPELK